MFRIKRGLKRQIPKYLVRNRDKNTGWGGRDSVFDAV